MRGAHIFVGVLGASSLSYAEAIRRHLEELYGIADWTVESIARESAAIGASTALLCEKILVDRPQTAHR